MGMQDQRHAYADARLRIVSTMPDPDEIPKNDPTYRPGYKDNPYSAPGQRVPFKILGVVLPIDYEMIHICIDAAGEGFDAKDKDAVPPCPPFFKQYESQWDLVARKSYAVAHAQGLVPTPAIIGRLVKVDPSLGYHLPDPWSGPEFLKDTHDPQIPWHTKRQQNVFLLGLRYGMRAGTADQIPQCPPLFGDVAHYYYGGAILGFELVHSSYIRKAERFLVTQFTTEMGKLDYGTIALDAIGAAITSSPVWFSTVSKMAGF
jgi:hypothetical protein